MLGLRLVKKTVNQDDPTVYHLFYADEAGSPGADITFFEYPGARRGRAGAGMVHTVTWRVALRGGARLLGAPARGRGRADAARRTGACASTIRRASVSSSRSSTTADAPLVAEHPEVPAELALQGFDSVRAFAADPERSRDLSERRSAFVPAGNGRLGGARREQGRPVRLRPAARRRRGRARRRHRAPRRVVVDDGGPRGLAERASQRLGMHPTPVIDRFWFRSVYFREPNGVLFELATLGPGFAVDEDPAHLGETLILPPAFEHLRDADRAGADSDREPARADARRLRATSMPPSRRGPARGR